MTARASSARLIVHKKTNAPSTFPPCYYSSSFTQKIYRFLLHSYDPKSYFEHLMNVASNYEQWAAAGAMLDRLTENEKWKNDPTSKDYDYQLLQDRLVQLQRARESGDLGAMMFMIRTSLSRNLGDMGNPKLYGNSYVGTKKLIEEYIDEVTRQMNFICDTESSEFSANAKYAFFTNTQRAFGRTALCLSGGGGLALSHVGVLKALFEAKLAPRVISGSSGGSIVAAVFCTRTDEEWPLLFDPKNVAVKLFEREEEEGDVLAKVARLFKHGVVYDVEVFIGEMRRNIGDVTFQEAFNRTRRILNITVSSSTMYEMPRLLNYLTAPNVIIWSAVAASCAIPFVYRSAPLMAKDKIGNFIPWNPSGHRWIDGSVEGFLLSYPSVNPHIVPFMDTSPAPSLLSRCANQLAFLVRTEIHHRLTQLADLGISFSIFSHIRSILSQKYYGDVTIVPDFRLADTLKAIGNPDLEMMNYCYYLGERAAWPRIPILRNHCQVELCLDEVLYRIRIR
ncbi:hypothetical protein BDK51DRAFT_21491, partial [Blyttiomyces helicus]